MADAVTKERPVRSSEAVQREAFVLAERGIDPGPYLVEHIGEITASDARAASNHFDTLNSATFTPDQKFYAGLVADVFKQPAGMAGPLTEGFEERKRDAQIEYRERIIAGEPARDVYADIEARGRLTINDPAFGTAMGAELRPRFAAPDPVKPGYIDVKASARALAAAFAERRLSEAEFRRQQALLIDWERLQKEQDKQAAATPAARR